MTFPEMINSQGLNMYVRQGKWILDLKKRIECSEGLLAAERAKSMQLMEDLASMTASDKKKEYRVKSLMDTVANEKKRSKGKRR